MENCELTCKLDVSVLLCLNTYYLFPQAPGEAEAELAYLNRIGVIDGILSDDVDNFLFGATVVIRKFVALSITWNTRLIFFPVPAIHSVAIVQTLYLTLQEKMTKITPVYSDFKIYRPILRFS